MVALADVITRLRAGAMRPRRWLVVGVAAAALAAGCDSLETQQRKWIFQPVQAPAASAEELARFASARGMRDVWIEHVSPSSGRTIRLHSLWAENADPAAPVLLYLHGARRDVGRNTYRVEQIRGLGFSVLAVDYRGFGNSTDELPSQAGVVEDAAAAWQWLERHRPDRARYLYGHSLGGAVAVQLAAGLDGEPAATRPDGVIVEGTFTSIGELFQTFKWGWLPLTPLITERFDSLAAVPMIKSRLLVVHGSDDSLVPSRLARALYDRATAPKRFLLVEGGTHWSTSWRGADQYRAVLQEFFGLKIGG
jgi:pimeloyl-ACP methyl ester carboxylesterase